jgi:hypothetical protein
MEGLMDARMKNDDLGKLLIEKAPVDVCLCGNKEEKIH